MTTPPPTYVSFLTNFHSSSSSAIMNSPPHPPPPLNHHHHHLHPLTSNNLMVNSYPRPDHVQLDHQKKPPDHPPNTTNSLSNSSSTSHQLCVAQGEGQDDDDDDDDDEVDHYNTTTQLEINHHQLKPPTSSQEGDQSSKKPMIIHSSKVKKKATEKERQQRFAFVTKSQVDNLEDGYRWRKYGQKAVKNSPFPRSYYRCTTQKCTVKKRVERSFEDASTVVTTYEGQHNHHVPTTLRGLMMQVPGPASPVPSSMMGSQIGSGISIMNMMGCLPLPPPPPPEYNSFIQHYYSGNSSSSTTNNNVNVGSQLQLQSSTSTAPLLQQLAEDYGLLQDMVPSIILRHGDHHHQLPHPPT